MYRSQPRLVSSALALAAVLVLSGLSVCCNNCDGHYLALVSTCVAQVFLQSTDALYMCCCHSLSYVGTGFNHLTINDLGVQLYGIYAACGSQQ
jgi:hypothetical protein